MLDTTPSAFSIVIIPRVTIIEGNNVSDDGKSISDDDEKFTKELLGDNKILINYLRIELRLESDNCN